MIIQGARRDELLDYLPIIFSNMLTCACMQTQKHTLAYTYTCTRDFDTRAGALYNTEGKALELHMNDVGSISSILHGPSSTPAVIPKCKIKNKP